MSLDAAAARITAVINGDKPDDEIVVSTNQAACVDFAERTLAKQGRVYVRGTSLAQVVRDYSGKSFINIPTGTPVIHALERERLRELIGSAGSWQKLDKRSAQAVPCMVPEWVPTTLMQRGEWKLPVLEGVTDTPVLRLDGSILDRPGYDPQSGILYEPNGTAWPTIKARPTRDDARAAFAELAELYCDFPFVADCDRSASIALTLSIVGRSAIVGCVPMFVVGATAPGSGKGLNSDVGVVIGTGRASPKMAGANDEEMRKRIFAVALEGLPVVTLDNIAGVFTSPALEAALTATVYHDRVLSVSKTRSAPMRTVFIMTANNVQLGGDLPRRVVPIDIDTKLENPDCRDGFRFPDLLGHVQRERPRLVVAALTILRAYIIAGLPAHGASAKGSYEAWDRLVRGAIIWTGAADPLGGESRIRANASVEKNDLRALVGAWREKFGLQSKTASEALDAAGDRGPLRAAMDAYSHGKPIDTKTLGSRLAKVRGRVVELGGELLCFHDDGVAHGGARLWKVGAP